MPLPSHLNWRYFADKAAKENDSQELMKHVSQLLQLLGEEYPAPIDPESSGQPMVVATPQGWRGFENKEHITQFLLSAVAATGAKFGNVQVFDSASGTLKIVAQHGFGSEFLTYFGVVTCDEASACAQALGRRRRMVVENVATDPIFEGQDSAAVMLRANAHSVQSTPLFGVSGDLLGVVSTHSDQPRTFSACELKSLDDLVAEFMASASGSMPAS